MWPDKGCKTREDEASQGEASWQLGYRVSRSLTRVTIDDSAGRSCGARILLESLAWALYSVTCPDALMSCWKATSGLVIEHLACERAAMGWPG